MVRRAACSDRGLCDTRADASGGGHRRSSRPRGGGRCVRSRVERPQEGPADHRARLHRDRGGQRARAARAAPGRATADRVAHEDDDRVARDRARRARREDPGRPCGHDRRGLPGRDRRGQALQAADAAPVDAAGLRQRLRDGTRDRRRRRIAQPVLRVDERAGARDRDDQHELRERVRARRRPESLDGATTRRCSHGPRSPTPPSRRSSPPDACSSAGPHRRSPRSG